MASWFLSHIIPTQHAPNPHDTGKIEYMCHWIYIGYLHCWLPEDQGKEAKFLKQGSAQYGKWKQTSTFMYYSPGL